MPALIDIGAQAEEARRLARTVVDIEVDSVGLDLGDGRPQARAAVLGADDFDEGRGDGLPLTELRAGGFLGAPR